MVVATPPRSLERRSGRGTHRIGTVRLAGCGVEHVPGDPPGRAPPRPPDSGGEGGGGGAGHGGPDAGGGDARRSGRTPPAVWIMAAAAALAMPAGFLVAALVHRGV